jgi:hypothetical protein
MEGPAAVGVPLLLGWAPSTRTRLGGLASRAKADGGQEPPFNSRLADARLRLAPVNRWNSGHRGEL